MQTLRQGSSGSDVKDLQQKLKDLGFDPKGVDGHFGPGTRDAVISFQQSKGLQADGIAGPNTLAALQSEGTASGADAGGAVTSGTAAGASGAATGAGAAAAPATANIPNVSVQSVAKIFPGVPTSNIQQNLPFVLQALTEAGLGDKDMVLMALATISAETGNFTPLSEFKSKFNTSPGGVKFPVSALMVARAIRTMSLSPSPASVRACRTNGRFCWMLLVGTPGKIFATLCTLTFGMFAVAGAAAAPAPVAAPLAPAAAPLVTAPPASAPDAVPSDCKAAKVFGPAMPSACKPLLC